MGEKLLGKKYIKQRLPAGYHHGLIKVDRVANQYGSNSDVSVKPRKKKKKPFKPARDLLEYGLFLFLRSFVTLMPPPVLRGFTRRIGDLAFLLDRKHRKTAIRNVAQVMGYPEDSEDAKSLARASFRNLVGIAVEFVKMPKTLKCGPDEVILEVEGKEKVEAALAKGKGLIFVSGHTGNWELMGAYTSSTIAPLYIISNPFRNPYLNKYLKKRRNSYRQELVLKKGALMSIARTLKKKRTVVLLVDQHAGRNEPKLDFLGIPAHTYITPGAMAARFGAPVIAGFSYRVGSSFQYKLYFEDPIYPDQERDAQEEAIRIAEYANEKIGNFVRAHPEQWLWMHRRWR